MTLLFLGLLVLTAVGLLSLSAITLRSSGQSLLAAQARANARLALMQAIGQLQKTMGPDRRITAPADILGKDVSQPRWTGVWRSHPQNSEDWLKRDDLNGGLHDSRSTADKSNPSAEVVGWLVSGQGSPKDSSSADQTVLVGKKGADAAVTAPRIGIDPTRGQAGHIAWWTGDLNTRANVQTPDAHAQEKIAPENPTENAYARILAAQRADESAMTGKVEIPDEVRAKLFSDPTASFATTQPAWPAAHFHDYTTFSSGVLADVNHGGLKRDLTAYFAGDGSIPSKDGLPGLDDEDLLVGQEPEDETSSRSNLTAPRFGLLRKWAQASVPFSSDSKVSAVFPETVAANKSMSQSMALCNETAVKIEGNRRSPLQPILVEATMYTQLSTYRVVPGLFQLRSMLYPRVTLWNPYNVKLTVPATIAMIQGNGRKEMWTTDATGFNTGWLSFEGGRSTAFPPADSPLAAFMSSDGYNDPYMGSYYFSLPETTFEPGECLTFSPDQTQEYNGMSSYRPGGYDLSANTLSCKVSPDPSRCYYVSANDVGGGVSFPPTQFWYAPTLGASTADQGDDVRAILKELPAGHPAITFEKFDSLPQLCVLSASLQYGAGREPRMAWNDKDKMPVQLLTKTNPKPTIIPNTRAREGIRMRWFQESASNEANAGPLTGTAFLQEAMLATWNPRASYIVRSPWENVGGTLPKSDFRGDTGGGPWFFGAYTRDLADQAVSWQDQTPVPGEGKFHGNPFGPPQEGKKRIVLFDVPRKETGVISMAQLQHAKLSEFIWHPSYAVGNSLADPRLGTGDDGGLDHTAASSNPNDEAANAGFGKNAIGWSSDAQRSVTSDSWAATGRALLLETPQSDNLVYDLSYEVNRTLWDRYYFSTGDAEAKEKFLQDGAAHPLPNGRMRLAPAVKATAEELGDFNRSAARLMVDGAFNVNSTRPEAWKAMLAASRRSGFGSGSGAPFPRVLNAPEGNWTAGDSSDNDSAWAGYRELSDTEIDRLADAIVTEVKLRGPFLSMADFVNRRLANDETGRMGALQAAIEKAGLNQAFHNDFPLDNSKSLPDYSHPDNIKDATRLEQTLKPDSVAWGIPGYLTQADVLQVLGPALTARSDSFVIRAYGDVTGANGQVVAQAWCEATVQRLPEPLKPDASGLNPANADQAGDFGRRFALASFRWLTKDEL